MFVSRPSTIFILLNNVTAERIRPLLLLLVCLATTTFLQADEKTPAKDAKADSATEPEKTIALVGGRVLTMTAAGELENATVLITGDKVKAVGTDVEIPTDATQIDVSGMTVSPGLIDCRSSLWLEAQSVSASSSTGSLNAIDGVDPYSDSWIEVARQGVTTVSVQPRGSLGGHCVVLRVAPATSTADLVVQEKASMQASLGLSGSTGNSRDRHAQYLALKKTLDAAKKYKEDWEKYEAAVKKAAEDKKKKPSSDKEKSVKSESKSKEAPKAEKPAEQPVESARERMIRRMREARGLSGRPGSSSRPGETKSTDTKSTSSKDGAPKKPKVDPIKAELVRVLNKELPLRIEVHRADDVANAMQLAEDFDLTFVFEGLSQAGRSWATLQEQHPPLVVGPFANYESTPSYASSSADRYEELNGVNGLVAIGTFSRDSRGSRLLRQHAAAAIAGGLSHEQVMRAITIDAARVLGIDSKTGSIESGKLADLTVIAGNPLNPAAPVMLTMSHGEIVFQQNDVKVVGHDIVVDVPELSADLPEAFVLTSERVVQADGRITAGSIQVKDGIIDSVTAGKSKKTDGVVFDMGQAVISPGLVVGHYSEISVPSTAAVASHIRAIDSFSPESKRLRKLSEAGFTSVMYAPDSRSVVAGQIGCVRFHADQPILMDGKEPLLPASLFVLSSDARSRNRYPAALSGQLKLINRYFSGKDTAGNLYVPTAVRSLLKKQSEQRLATLKDKSTIAVLEAESSAEVEAALSVIDAYDLKAIVLNPDDLRTSIDAIQQAKAGLIVRSSSVTDHDWYAQDIATASNRGISVAVSGTDAGRIRQTLATLVNAGMSPESALRSVTSDAASSLGLTGIGTLAKGSVADLVIWNGSPLNPAARPIHVIVDGRLTKEAK